jgi:hypothetical protein
MAQERLVISNTTPLINLAEIERLDLLERLFGKIVIPPAVRDELIEKESIFERAAKAAVSGQFEIMTPADKIARERVFWLHSSRRGRMPGAGDGKFRLIASTGRSCSTKFSRFEWVDLHRNLGMSGGSEIPGIG